MIKNNKFEYDVLIMGGLGRVGLPLGIVLASKGLKVCLFDIDETRAASVAGGKMPFLEHGADELLKEVINKNLFVSTAPAVISKSKFVVVVIGTPVDEHLNPRFSVMKDFFISYLSYFMDGQDIILRSTVFPGTSLKINRFLNDSGLKVRVTFCPERIAQGKAIEELSKWPQIVSGFDKEAVAEVSKLFRVLTEDIIVLDPMEAELAKLFTNAWRYIQFAVANQFYMIADSYGIDFYRIHDAMKYNYPRAKDLPGAGFAAGPCLFKDTMQLSALNDNSFFLGHAAMLINEGLPNFIVNSIKRKQPVRDKVVGILGMAFKADIDDKRESLAYKLKKIMEMEAKKVLCSDVYIKEEGFVSSQELIDNSDIIIIAAPHEKYKNLSVNNKVVIDVWNFFSEEFVRRQAPAGSEDMFGQEHDKELMEERI